MLCQYSDEDDEARVEIFGDRLFLVTHCNAVFRWQDKCHPLTGMDGGGRTELHLYRLAPDIDRAVNEIAEKIEMTHNSFDDVGVPRPI